jgi:hypothetical protein
LLPDPDLEQAIITMVREVIKMSAFFIKMFYQLLLTDDSNGKLLWRVVLSPVLGMEYLMKLSILLLPVYVGLWLPSSYINTNMLENSPVSHIKAKPGTYY